MEPKNEKYILEKEINSYNWPQTLNANQALEKLRTISSGGNLFISTKKLSNHRYRSILLITGGCLQIGEPNSIKKLNKINLIYLRKIEVLQRIIKNSGQVKLQGHLEDYGYEKVRI